MTVLQLGQTLNEMYFGSKKGESVVMIHLFGIKYASEIKESGASMHSIVKTAGIPLTYATEVSKGVKLSQFVTVK